MCEARQLGTPLQVPLAPPQLRRGHLVSRLRCSSAAFWEAGRGRATLCEYAHFLQGGGGGLCTPAVRKRPQAIWESLASAASPVTTQAWPQAQGISVLLWDGILEGGGKGFSSGPMYHPYSTLGGTGSWSMLHTLLSFPRFHVVGSPWGKRGDQNHLNSFGANSLISPFVLLLGEDSQPSACPT